jgi:hypothetical protein
MSNVHFRSEWYLEAKGIRWLFWKLTEAEVATSIFSAKIDCNTAVGLTSTETRQQTISPLLGT